MLDSADDKVPRRESLQVADQRQVVGFRAAAGEDDLVVGGAQNGCHSGSCSLHGETCPPAEAMEL